MFFKKNAPVWDNVEKYSPGRQTIDDNMAHAQKRSDLRARQLWQEHTHPFILCNTYCVSTTTVVMWTRVGVTLWVHGLPLFHKKREMPWKVRFLFMYVCEVCVGGVCVCGVCVGVCVGVCGVCVSVCVCVGVWRSVCVWVWVWVWCVCGVCVCVGCVWGVCGVCEKERNVLWWQLFC